MNVCMVENQNSKNGFKAFFFEKKVYLPFSLVHLVKVFVHSGLLSCTFTFKFVQKLQGFVHLPNVFVHLHLCTVGYISCTLALYLCTIGAISCTNGSYPCTNGGEL